MSVGSGDLQASCRETILIDDRLVKEVAAVKAVRAAQEVPSNASAPQSLAAVDEGLDSNSPDGFSDCENDESGFEDEDEDISDNPW